MQSMKIKPQNFYLSAGELAEGLGLTVSRVLDAAQAAGVDEYSLQISGIGFFDLVACAMIVRHLASTEGQIDFPGHPVLLAEIQRQQSEIAATAHTRN